MLYEIDSREGQVLVKYVKICRYFQEPCLGENIWSYPSYRMLMRISQRHLMCES